MRRHGVTVLDATFAPFPAGSRHDVASVTKSIMSLLIGAAVYSRLLRGGDVRLGELIEGLDARHGAITIADLLGMESGLECGYGAGETELREMLRRADWIQFALQLPMGRMPGEEFSYCSPNYHILSAVLTRVSGMSAAAYAQRTLFAPLHINDVYWPADPQGITHGWGDLQLRPRDVAKIGELLLHDGVWDGRRIIGSDWLRWSTTPRVQSPGGDWYAYGWWTPTGAPSGLFEANGRGGQRLSIWPAKDVVVVMAGGGFEPGVLGSKLLESAAADSALTPRTPNARQRLNSALRAARQRRVDWSASDVPPCREAIAAGPFRLSSNYLGMTEFMLHEDAITLRLPDRSLRLPLRSDGRFARVNERVDGIETIARGRWEQPCRLLVEWDLLGKIDHYTMNLSLTDNAATVNISERTGLINETATAERALGR
jgi:CubicO group peptidase (beta-lactamase class C family)